MIGSPIETSYSGYNETRVNKLNIGWFIIIIIITIFDLVLRARLICANKQVLNQLLLNGILIVWLTVINHRDLLVCVPPTNVVSKGGRQQQQRPL